jgi:hypothetical protein
MDVKAEEMEEDAVDLSVGVVFSKKYEEPESCGSAADFSLGVAMESDSSGGEGSADNALLNINDSNKCHCLSQIQSPTAVNDDQVETKSVVNKIFKVHVMGLFSRLLGECIWPP